MITKQPTTDPRVCQVHLTRDGQWARITLSLGGMYTGGKLADAAPEFTNTLEGNDEVTVSYTATNWLSAIASGARYAFRSLNLPKRRLLVSELAGVLGEAGMEALAHGAAVGVARLSACHIPLLELEGWQVECDLASAEGSLEQPEENGVQSTEEPSAMPASS